MAQRNRVISREGAAWAAEHGSVECHAIDGIHAVQHEDFKARLAGGFQGVAQRGNVGVKTAANVLDVEYQRVQILQLFRLRSPRFAIQAVNRESRGCLLYTS